MKLQLVILLAMVVFALAAEPQDVEQDDAKVTEKRGAFGLGYGYGGYGGLGYGGYGRYYGGYYPRGYGYGYPGAYGGYYPRFGYGGFY